jgi:hypothetical protein
MRQIGVATGLASVAEGGQRGWLNLSGALLKRDGGFDATHKSEVHF